MRFDKNIKDQRDPAHRGRISHRRRRDVSDLYNRESDRETRRYFQIQPRNSRILRFNRLDISLTRFSTCLLDKATTYLTHLTLSNNHSELAPQTTHLEREYDFITRRTDHPADDMSMYIRNKRS